jgi:hypothetical protein
VIVINEAMASREYPNQDPIGRRFSLDTDDQGKPLSSLEIVGVVGNVRQYRADEEPVPMTYAPSTAAPPARANALVIRTAGEPMAIAGSIRSALQSLDSSLPITPPRTRDEVVGASLTQRRFNMTLLIVFDDRADSRDRRHLRDGRVCGRPATGDRHSRRPGRYEPRDSRHGAVRIAQAGDRGIGIGIASLALTTAHRVSSTASAPRTRDVHFAADVAGCGCVLAGLFPALRASRIDPLEALRVE